MKQMETNLVFTEPCGVRDVAESVVPVITQSLMFSQERGVLDEQATTFGLQLVHACQCSAFCVRSSAATGCRCPV